MQKKCRFCKKFHTKTRHSQHAYDIHIPLCNRKNSTDGMYLKKLKKIVLSSDVYRLTNMSKLMLSEAIPLLPQVCGGKSKDECSGICHAYGYEGSCGWISKTPPGICTCAVVYMYGGYTGED